MGPDIGFDIIGAFAAYREPRQGLFIAISMAIQGDVIGDIQKSFCADGQHFLQEGSIIHAFVIASFAATIGTADKAMNGGAVFGEALQGDMIVHEQVYKKPVFVLKQDPGFVAVEKLQFVDVLEGFVRPIKGGIGIMFVGV